MCFTRFAEDAIRIYGYRYPPASVFPYGEIAYEQISDIDPSKRQITIKDNEILFVGSEESLTLLCAERSVPSVRRVDVWSLIVEPFLILGLDDEHAERTLQTLEENGISRRETARLRAFLEDDMISHNNFYSEAYENDMREVLNVEFSKLLLSSWNRLRRDEFREFYWQFMEIALRAKAFGTDGA